MRAAKWRHDSLNTFSWIENDRYSPLRLSKIAHMHRIARITGDFGFLQDMIVTIQAGTGSARRRPGKLSHRNESRRTPCHRVRTIESQSSIISPPTPTPLQPLRMEEAII